ncbi:MAG: 50S ribosomal protein L25 [Microthrixaceae bacterium]|nr:50S ribosomal protein L25 [Microthrixaceae bacterium]
MSQFKLSVTTGRAEGSRASRRLRTERQVPGVVYGLGADPISVSVDASDLRRALTTDAGLNALLDLDVAGDHEMAVVKDLQRHPVRRDVVHVDFLRVDPEARIEVEVPIHTEGEADKVHQEDGIAVLRLSSLLVSVKPTDIPDEVVVDISELTMDSTITVEDLDLPENVDVVTPGDEVIVSAELTRAALVEEEPAEGEAGEEGEAAEASAGAEDSGDSSGED